MSATGPRPAAHAGSGEQLQRINDRITLCYETFGHPADPPLLLVMGLGMQMIAWDDELCAMFAGQGFHVIRFDNRDAGRSTNVKRPRPPGVRQLATRRFHPDQYTLADMAGDAAGLLRSLDLAPAHVVGASLGGMVAQTLAARHPDSVRTLTSIMSTSGDRFRGQPGLGTYRYLLRAAPRDRDAFIEHTATIFGYISSPGFEVDDDAVRARAARSYERGTNPAGTGRQLAAILKSGDRSRELAGVTAPTLVIHGTADRMVRVSGGRATAKAIPGADLMLVDGMGHDLPRALWPRIVDAVAERAHRFDGERAPA